MRITLADTDTDRSFHVWQRLSKLPGVLMIDRCGGLTDAFNCIEHRPPQIILYSQDLIKRPEFDVMQTLCKCLSVRWGIMLEGPSPHTASPNAIDLAASDADLLASLKACLNGECAIPSRASVGLFRSTGDIDPDRIVLIGSSTGGIDALLSVLGTFPVDCSPTLIVQHTGSGFGPGLVRLLDQRAEPKVKEAKNGEALSIGKVLVATTNDHHLKLTPGPNPTCMLDPTAKVSGHCPSVDVLFHSAIPNAKNVTAVILTGMGRDGADGIAALKAAGAHTIGQNEATCIVYGMPRAAAELGALKQTLPLASIGPAILKSMQRALA